MLRKGKGMPGASSGLEEVMPSVRFHPELVKCKLNKYLLSAFYTSVAV